MSSRNRLIACAAAVLLAGCGMTPEEEAKQIEEGLLATPGAEEHWRTIKEEFPDDFAALVAKVQALDDADRGDEAKLIEIGANWMLEFQTRILPDAVKAPPKELLAWSAAEGDLYATLQRGAVEQCAQLTMGQSIRIDQSNAVATAAMARRNLAIIRASAAAMRDPQQYPEPSEAAFTRLGDAIAATGLDPKLQAALASESDMLALSPEQQCKIGVAIYAGLRSLPDDAEPEMAAYMMTIE